MGPRQKNSEFRILDAMWVLETFTVADLTRYARVNRAGVESALVRWKGSLEKTGKRPARTGRGRPQLEYRLSQIGLNRVEEVFASNPLTRPYPLNSFGESQGLRLVEHILIQEVPAAEGQARTTLLKEAKALLAFAQARIDSSSPIQFQQTIQLLSGLLEQMELNTSLRITPEIRATIEERIQTLSHDAAFQARIHASIAKDRDLYCRLGILETV